MALNLINSENLALVEGTRKTVGDSLEARVENLEERIAPLESHATWTLAGTKQSGDSDKSITIPAGVNPQDFFVVLGMPNADETIMFPALADSYTSGTRTRNYYVGSAATGDTISYTLVANSSGKTYTIAYTGSNTRSISVYYR